MFEPFIPIAAPLLAVVEAEPISETAGSVLNLVPLLLLLPIAGFVFTALFGRRIGRFAFLVPLLLIVATWAIAMVVVFEALTGGFGEHGAGITLYTWIPAGDFQVELGLFVDQLTACLLIVVTTIGMLVHLYSIGYMAHDPGRWRFFAYLNLFMFSMLLLVLGDSLLTLFAAWELVGLCSLPADRLLVHRAVGGAGGQEGLHRQPRRRRRLRPRDHADLGQHRDAELPRVVRADRGARHDDDRRRSPCWSSAARSARAPSSRSTSGCPTRWRARPRSPP